MRVVGIVALVSALGAACALQPADGNDETAPGSASQTTPASATVSGGTTAGGHVGATTSDQGPQDPGSLAPGGLPPQCMRPPCDPQPQPWGGRPPVVLYK
jgi:hypothetical protein